MAWLLSPQQLTPQLHRFSRQSPIDDVLHQRKVIASREEPCRKIWVDGRQHELDRLLLTYLYGRAGRQKKNRTGLQDAVDQRSRIELNADDAWVEFDPDNVMMELNVGLSKARRAVKQHAKIVHNAPGSKAQWTIACLSQSPKCAGKFSERSCLEIREHSAPSKTSSPRTRNRELTSRSTYPKRARGVKKSPRPPGFWLLQAQRPTRPQLFKIPPTGCPILSL